MYENTTAGIEWWKNATKATPEYGDKSTLSPEDIDTITNMAVQICINEGYTKEQVQEFTLSYRETPVLSEAYNDIICKFDAHLKSFLFGNLEQCKYALEKGAYADSLNEEGYTALTRACEKGDLDLAKLLIEHHANVNLHDKDGITPLHSACANGFLEIVRLLISNEADVNLSDIPGPTDFADFPLTPLRWASTDGIRKLLIEHGARGVDFVQQIKDAIPDHIAAMKWWENASKETPEYGDKSTLSPQTISIIEAIAVNNCIDHKHTIEEVQEYANSLKDIPILSEAYNDIIHYGTLTVTGEDPVANISDYQA
ncbi:MAG: ankyrin repeat domain-containing protein [Rickettsiaceae bacterium]|nr:ankyrin repeat domain-containing protein [Rickettsiaceae bacterium]